MITRLRVRNFKRFEDVDIELGKAVVLIGPNNSGKSSALQALALWDLGLKRWNEKRKDSASPEKRPGVTINRRDLYSVPIPEVNLLWRNLRVRHLTRVANGETTRPKTENVRIEIIVDGVTGGKAWSCGLEFDYANDESLYCRPLRLDEKGSKRMQVPVEAGSPRIAFLPPMSGLADREYQKQPGEINVLIGQGQTAQVLRNLSHRIYSGKNSTAWDAIKEHIKSLFGAELLPPKLIAERSEITMSFTEDGKNFLDLSSSGRGLQQTLLLLAHLYDNTGSVLLLDEPDAHLEVLRQRQIYSLLKLVAEDQRSQIIAASHSEIVLNEAAGRDVVIAFIGKPHRIDDKKQQVLKALRDIGFDQYAQAEQNGWVHYLEHATDLAILQSFAATLGHRAAKHLERPFIKYIETNLPHKAREHFHGLKEAKPDLVGIAIFDRLDKELQNEAGLKEMMWKRREIENYFCAEDVLIEYSKMGQAHDLFGEAESRRREQAMRESIEDVAGALVVLGKGEPWSHDLKATDEFLEPLFKKYFEKLSLPLIFRKSDYHALAGLMPAEKLDPEITEKLDAIVETAEMAKPLGE